MAAMQTTMISASMTAYSTAVGPSSRLRKLTNFFFRFASMSHILSFSPEKRTSRGETVTVHRPGNLTAASPGANVAPGRFLGGLAFRQPGDPRGTHGFASH